MKHIKNLDRTICSLILFLLIIITVLQIILRSLFNIPFVGVEELSRYFFIAFVETGFMCALPGLVSAGTLKPLVIEVHIEV